MVPEHETPMIEMHVQGVRVHPAQDDRPKQHVVVLGEIGGEQRLHVWIGPAEAQAIAIYLQKLETPRPMTLTFVSNIMAAAGARLSEVRINRLSGDVYYAEAIVMTPGGRQLVDARPSDAIALALAQGVPIRVDPEVLVMAGASLEERETPGSRWLEMVAGPHGVLPAED